MHRSSEFSEILDAAERLSLEENETPAVVLRNRAAEERRAEIKKEIAQARKEHADGKTTRSTAKQIMRDLRK